MPPHLLRLSLAFAAVLSLLALPALAAGPPPGRVLMASLLLGGLLAALAAHDFDQLRLPDLLTLPLLGLGIAATWWIGAAGVAAHALAAAAAGLALWAAGALYRHLRRRAGLGLGDVKLLAALSAWVGPEGVVTLLVLACAGALAAVAAALLTGRRIEPSTPVPFGIFLALGGWVTWIYGPLI
jgi:leader peptidase (prepilin peptidase)/N-methyltransferase